MDVADVTAPLRSRWDQEDAEFVASDADWMRRCARRLTELDRFLLLDQALGLAFEIGSASASRARSPERVAEELLRVVDCGLAGD